MQIEFKRLEQVDRAELVDLMNNPEVLRHMPLASGVFDSLACEDFLAAKAKLWNEHGYGPWAFFVNTQFAGWGGLQAENGSPDLALVLHPNYWGHGTGIYREIISRAFGEMGFDHITALLPPTRKRLGALRRLGFKPDGELTVGKEKFVRFRLDESG